MTTRGQRPEARTRAITIPIRLQSLFAWGAHLLNTPSSAKPGRRSPAWSGSRRVRMGARVQSPGPKRPRPFREWRFLLTFTVTTAGSRVRGRYEIRHIAERVLRGALMRHFRRNARPDAVLLVTIAGVHAPAGHRLSDWSHVAMGTRRELAASEGPEHSSRESTITLLFT